MKVAGIYKITSPSGKIYIGQSWNVGNRWNEYKSKGAPGQVILNRSFQKYGIDNHQFALVLGLHNPTQEILDSCEKLYMKWNRDDGKELLNIREGGSSGKNSVETRERMSKSATGRLHSESTKTKMGLTRKGRKYSDEWKKNISDGQLGRKSPMGSNHCHAKLNETQVLEIRKKSKEGITKSALAKEYGVSNGQICLIVNRKLWKHI